ncbi:SMI1/KNR4 family protein [Brevundimonas mediterranea]
MAVRIPRTTGLTEDQIEGAERALGCKLPTSIRAFAYDHDGAEPEDNVFDLPDNQASVRAFISLTDAHRLRREIDGFPTIGVPIAEDDCGNYVWVKPQTGEILFWDHEVESDGVVIANDFDAFIAALKPFHRGSVKLQPGHVARVWVRPGFEPEFD